MSNISRSRTRKFLFQYLYAKSFSQVDKQKFIESFFEGRFEGSLDENYILHIEEIIENKEPVLLGLIQKYAPRFDVRDMHIEYILPIYIGASEMLFLNEEIPAKVSINESIELCKKYADDSARKIVNGILNNIFKDIDSLKNNLEENKIDNYSIFSK